MISAEARSAIKEGRVALGGEAIFVRVAGYLDRNCFREEGAKGSMKNSYACDTFEAKVEGGGRESGPRQERNKERTEAAVHVQWK